MRFKYYLFAVLIIVALVWFATPIYQYLAHRGLVSFVPWTDFVSIAEPAPARSQLHHTEYAPVADNALAQLRQFRQQINAPSASFAIAIDGQMIWSGVAGWRDVEAGLAANFDTQYRLGSTSKALTAMAAARLVERGELDLDAAIGSYIESLPNDDWASITPRQLLSHTSGLPHYPDNTDYLGLYQTIRLDRHYASASEALNMFDNSDLLFAPSTNYHYSSYGTVLLSAVIEQIRGVSFAEFVQQELFAPLHMTATQAEQQASLSTSPHLASFYWNNKGRSNKVKRWREIDLSHRLAGGGFVSTSSELVQFGMAVLQLQVVNATTLATFTQVQSLADGTASPDNYALGWRVAHYDLANGLGQITFINHGGVSRGAQSILALIPEHKTVIALNINANTESFSQFTAVIKPMLELFLSHKHSNTSQSTSSATTQNRSQRLAATYNNTQLQLSGNDQ